MDILFLIIGGLHINGRAKLKGLNNRRWVLRMVLVCVLFEILGAVISFSINGGNLMLSIVFGFFCLIGGFLLTKYRLDKTPSNIRDSENNRG